MQRPGQGDLRRCVPELAAQLLVGLEAITQLLDLLLPRGIGAAPVHRLPSAPPSSPRPSAPGEQTHAQVPQRRNHLELDGAGGEVVQTLLADELEQASPVCQALPDGDLPGGEVADPDMGDLTLAHQPVRASQLPMMVSLKPLPICMSGDCGGP